MDTATKVCPDCDSVIRGDVCLNCGFVFEKGEADNSVDDKSEAVEKKESKKEHKSKEVKKQKPDNVVEPKSSDTEVVAPTPVVVAVAKETKKDTEKAETKPSQESKDDKEPSIPVKEEKSEIVPKDDFLNGGKESENSKQKVAAISGLGVLFGMQKQTVETPTESKELSDTKQPQNDKQIDDPKLSEAKIYDFTGNLPEDEVSENENENDGESSDAENAEVSDATPVKEEKKPEETHTKVQSIFVDIAKSDGSAIVVVPDTKVKSHSKLVPIILSLILVVIGLLSYWRFIYYTPEYISPLVLSANDVREAVPTGEGEGLNEVSSDLNSQEKTLVLELPLDEGNFEKDDFSAFSPTDVKMLLTTFGINRVFEKFLDNELYKKVQSDFDFDTDDVDVYLSKGFSILYPNDDFKTWGFVTEVQKGGETFVKERLAKFEKDKESNGEKYAYKDYYAEYVTVGTNGKLETNENELLVVSETKDDEEKDSEDGADSEDGDVKGDSTDEAEDSQKTNEEADTTEKDEQEPEVVVEKKSYLLVSDSKEFLDQMKESAEGNLTNLQTELKFAQAKTELPKSGQVYIYKKQTPTVWTLFADTISKKFDYVGLDKILGDISTYAITIYTKDGKLKIVSSSE